MGSPVRARAVAYAGVIALAVASVHAIRPARAAADAFAAAIALASACVFASAYASAAASTTATRGGFAMSYPCNEDRFPFELIQRMATVYSDRRENGTAVAIYTAMSGVNQTTERIRNVSASIRRRLDYIEDHLIKDYVDTDGELSQYPADLDRAIAERRIYWKMLVGLLTAEELAEIRKVTSEGGC